MERDIEGNRERLNGNAETEDILTMGRFRECLCVCVCVGGGGGGDKHLFSLSYTPLKKRPFYNP